MSQASDYLELKLLDHIVGKTSYTMPTVYLALCSATVTDAMTGSTITEVSYTGYARKVTAGGDWNAAAAGNIDNAAELAFPECTAGSDTVTHFALVDASSAGNLLCYGTLTTPLAISVGVTPKFSAGDLDISLD